MVECEGQAGESEKPIVTSEMRVAGAAILLDADLAFSAEEKAEAVYNAMESVKNIHKILPKRACGKTDSPPHN